MDEGARLLAIGSLSAVGLTAAFLAAGGLFPGVMRRTRRAAEDSTGRSFWLGLVNVLFLAAVGLGMSALAENAGAEILQVPALLIFTALTVLLLLGLTAVAEMLGARLFMEASSFRQHLGGAIVLILGGLTPFVGWFILFPYVGLLGVGAVILGWSRRRRSSEEESRADTA